VNSFIYAYVITFIHIVTKFGMRGLCITQAGTATRLRAEQPRGRGSISDRGNVQTGFGAHPARYTMGTVRCVPAGREAGDVRLATHFRLVLRLRMHGAIPPQPQPRDNFKSAILICSHIERIKSIFYFLCITQTDSEILLKVNVVLLNYEFCLLYFRCYFVKELTIQTCIWEVLGLNAGQDAPLC
jgi:hypothetical protein